MIFRSWLLALWHLSMRISTQQVECFVQKRRQTTQPQHHAWQQALQTRRSIGTVATRKTWGGGFVIA